MLDKQDKNHTQIQKIFEQYDTIITSNYIIDELITLCRVRNLKSDKFIQFIDNLLKEVFCPILFVTRDLEYTAWEILRKYLDHKFSFTDCTSFALMKQNNINKACTLDKHFIVAGFTVIGLNEGIQ